jgi:hypothetical protein
MPADYPYPFPATICADEPPTEEVIVGHLGPGAILVAIQGAHPLILRGGPTHAPIRLTVYAVESRVLAGRVLTEAGCLVRRAQVFLEEVGRDLAAPRTPADGCLLTTRPVVSL